MPQYLKIAAILLAAYVLGSIPWGLIIVKVTTGKDIRTIESGRTGGTNAMRAAGFAAGLATAILDFLKGASSVWITHAVLPGHPIVEIMAPLAAILGHNYSVFLLEIDRKMGLRLRGGAGGAACAGAIFALWPPAAVIVLVLGGLIWYWVGYASVTTMSIALTATLIFTYRAAQGLNPWSWVVFGVVAEAFMLWALRPNIERLKNGTERLHGFRARLKQQKLAKATPRHEEK